MSSLEIVSSMAIFYPQISKLKRAYHLSICLATPNRSPYLVGIVSSSILIYPPRLFVRHCCSPPNCASRCPSPLLRRKLSEYLVCISRALVLTYLPSASTSVSRCVASKIMLTLSLVLWELNIASAPLSASSWLLNRRCSFSWMNLHPAWTLKALGRS